MVENWDPKDRVGIVRSRNHGKDKLIAEFKRFFKVLGTMRIVNFWQNSKFERILHIARNVSADLS